MTLKEFEEEKREKTPSEYEKWFDECFWFVVDIGGIEQPCIKLTSRKVALRDGSIYMNDRDKEIRRLEDLERQALKIRYEMMQTYDRIEILDKMSLKEYLKLLDRKSSLERDLKHLEELPEGTVYCSFCGKSQDEVKRLVAGRSNCFICDECINICDDIMEEELGSEKKRLKEAKGGTNDQNKKSQK